MPRGPGIDDFLNPNNDPGCLKGSFDDFMVENQSAWYYFEFREDMPLNSVIEFTISPGIIPGQIIPDYDFAIFGPDVKCDSLGSPKRCSFAVETCDLCPETGLGKGAIDTTEGALDSDGFVAPLVVQPGQGFYLMLDNFNFNGIRTVFTLTWGGSAAPYLNCLANPICRNKTVDAGDDMQFCQGPAPFILNASVQNATSRVKYEWLGTPQALSFLSAKNILQPTVTIPADFTGSLDYILSISDGDCVTADALTVMISPNPPADLRADTDICQGEFTTISLTNLYQSYQWSNGATTPTITVNSGGTYAVTVSNGGTCTNTDEIIITLQELPKPTIEGGGKLCTGEVLTLRTNEPYATYFWSNGSRDPVTTINRGGNYSVTVTDANNCRGTGSLNVTEFSKPTPEIVGNTTFCEGQTATLATSQMYDVYQWSSNENTPTITVNQSGEFFVTVTDVNGCQGTNDITLTQSPLPTLSVDGDRIFCENGDTELTASTNATQIRWSTGASTSTISVDTPGDYTVTVSTTDGCERMETLTIQQQPQPQPFITDSITICPETAAMLQAQGIFAKYQWSTGDTTATIKVTQPGNYTLQVSDQLGCTGTASQTVDIFPVVPVPDISGVTNFCPETGTTLTVSGNYAGYNWSNGTTGTTTQVFATGTYAIIVSDANGCTSQDSITVQAFVVTAPTSDTVSFCTGNSAVFNAGGNYIDFNWSDGSTQPTLSVNTPGAYGVTVTDNNSCTSNATYIALENTLPQVTIQGESRFCKNSTTQLTAPAGFRNYQWSTNAITENIIVQTPGNYGLTVTDNNGCSNQTSATVTELPLPTPEMIAPDILCAEEQAILSLNTSFEQYSWSDGTQQSELIINQGGTYAVTVTDENGCIGFTSKNVNAFPNPIVAITADTTLCQGASTSITATPGFPSYQWSNGGTQDTTNINTAGNYSVTVTDNNGCKATETVTIKPVSSPIANAGQNQTLDCDTKSLQIGMVLSEQGSYRFVWQGPGINSSNVNSQQPFVDQPGTYTLVVIDTLNSCESATAMVEVTDVSYTPQISLSLQDTLDCNTASVTIDAAGSHQSNGITYQWYNDQQEVIPNERNLNFTTGQPGIYYFEIKDVITGCSAIQSIQVTADFDPAYVEAGPEQTLNCNNNQVTLSGSTSSEADYILYKWMGPNGNRISNQLETNVDQPGWYILTITNAKNGCSNLDSVLVQIDRTPPVVSAGTAQAIDCNVTTATLQGSLPVNGSSITYAWSANNDFVFTNPSQLLQTVNKAGLYILAAQNLDNGCTASDSVLITDNSNYPTELALQVIDPTCFGAKNGQVRIQNVTGGTGPYFFSLNGSPLESVEQFANLGAGNYQLRVEDVAGCAYETEVALKEGVLLKADLGKDTSVRFGARITLEAFVNVPTQTIVDLKWSGNIVENCFDNCWLQPVAAKDIGEFIYTVTVTNEAGCVATDDIKVEVENSRGVYIPQAFSPNGDGYNDVFMIYAGTEVVTVKSLVIMSRWGNMVYQAKNFRPNDPTRGWNGRLPGGNDFNPGVFVYLAQIEFIDGAIVDYWGDVTLVK